MFYLIVRKFQINVDSHLFQQHQSEMNTDLNWLAEKILFTDNQHPILYEDDVAKLYLLAYIHLINLLFYILISANQIYDSCAH